jgi:hypothetical protein
MEANVSHDGLSKIAAGNWRHSPVDAPAGAMTGLGVHLTDLFISFAGRPVSPRATPRRTPTCPRRRISCPVICGSLPAPRPCSLACRPRPIVGGSRCSAREAGSRREKAAMSTAACRRQTRRARDACVCRCAHRSRRHRILGGGSLGRNAIPLQRRGDSGQY